MSVGVLGCGPIADFYVTAAKRFSNLTIVSCAGSSQASVSARKLADRHGLRTYTYGEMLTDPGIDTVLVLTPAEDHFTSAMAAIEARKNVYCEKPLTTRSMDAYQLVEAARAADVALGSAPDTVLGANVQIAKALLSNGAIGTPVSGFAAMGSAGMEHWHPDPAHLFRLGGGPVLDLGPYYVASLITLLGPVASVSAQSSKGRDHRTITAPGSTKSGERFPVEVDTHVVATLQFCSGQLFTLLLSWDIPAHSLPQIEIYGTQGTLTLDDPNWFGGSIRHFDGSHWRSISTADHPLGRPTMTDVYGVERADHRGIGIAEMADAVIRQRQPQCSGELALHVLDVLTGINEATKTGVSSKIRYVGRGFLQPTLDADRANKLIAG